MKFRLALFFGGVLFTSATFGQQASSVAEPKPPAASAAPLPLGGTGTPNHVAKWTTSTTIGNSGIFETTGGNVGIGTTTPASKLDLHGTEDVRDTLTLFPNGTHPALSLSGTAFEINNAGKIIFVAGQVFPGTGTVSTVNSGTGLVGGPIHTTGTLSINAAVVPLLTKSNVFSNNQTINGNLAVTNVVLNGSAARSVGVARNPTAGESGNALTISGGGAASGATDAAGGDLILAAGDGTGSGGSGAVRVQAAADGPSGTEADSLVDRQIFGPKSVSMGGQSGTVTPFVLNVANGDGAGATLRFTIRANDGASNFAAETGSCVIAVAASSDGSMSAAGLIFSADSVDTGGINASCDIVGGNSGNELGIAVSDSLTFAPTVHSIFFEIDNVSGTPVVMLVPLASHLGGKLGQSVSPAHRRTQVQIRH
jgi:hypothetical protein